jgi:glycosyltransferase involved in cell wall biosynthesis
LEKNVLERADLVIATTANLKELFQAKVPSANIVSITNGADWEDFDFNVVDQNTPEQFQLIHLGLLNELRNPENLWLALEELCIEEPSFSGDLKIILSGTISESILTRIQNSNLLLSHLTVLDYVPHQEVITYYSKSALLLLLLNLSEQSDLMIPGKLFEYLFAQRPILAIGTKEGEVNHILKDCGASEVVNPHSKIEIKNQILEAYEKFKMSKSVMNYKNVERFTRKNLTKQLVDSMNELEITK